MGKDSAQESDDFSQHPVFLKVLGKYPDLADPPAPPAAAKHWDESDFEIFVASMGSIVPQRAPKKAADNVPTPAAEESGKELQSPMMESVALFECAPRAAAPSPKLTKKEEDKALQASVSPHASGESIRGEPHIKGKGMADASLVIPSTLFMEDKAPEGLKLEAILTKFDRCRAACLQSISGMSTFSLVKEHGVGILLADLSFCVETEALPDLIDDVFVESEIDLPKMPQLPSLQRLVDRNGKSSCTATFSQMFVDMKTGMLSGNSTAYNCIKRPCDQIFERQIPNSKTLAVRKELAHKWTWPRPALGRPFKPTKYLQGRYVIAPSDCDTYNTMYHPKAPSVCEHAALSTGETWACRPCNAFYCKFLSTLLPGTSLLVHILVEETADVGTRALFAYEKKGEENSCVLCAFAVYGGSVPGVVYQEEFSAVTPKSGQALASWAKSDGDQSRLDAFAKTSGCDLSALA